MVSQKSSDLKVLQIGQVYLLGLRLNLKPLWLGEGHRQLNLFPSLFQNFNCLFIFSLFVAPGMSTPNAMNNQPGYGPPMSQQQPQGPPPQGPPAPQGYPVQQPPMMSQPSQAPPGMSQGQQMPPQQSMMQQSQASSANMMGGPSGGPPPSSQPMGSRAMPPPNAYRRSPSQGRLNMQGEKFFFRK